MTAPRAGLRLISRKEILDVVLASDIVFEILDARIPESLRNRFLERAAERGGKRLVIVLNKSDLVPERVLREWVDFYEGEGLECVVASASRAEILGIGRILSEAGRGARASFFGAPKVGKSSLVNSLKGRRSASVSRYPGSPGYTRGVQIYRVGHVYIYDTPGSLPVEADPLERILRTRPPERIENPVGVALKLISRIERAVPGSLRSHYGIEWRDPLELLERIARSRGWILRGSGEPNVEEAARDLVRRYLDGRIAFYTRPDQEVLA